MRVGLLLLQRGGVQLFELLFGIRGLAGFLWFLSSLDLWLLLLELRLGRLFVCLFVRFRFGLGLVLVLFGIGFLGCVVR